MPRGGALRERAWAPDRNVTALPAPMPLAAPSAFAPEPETAIAPAGNGVALASDAGAAATDSAVDAEATGLSPSAPETALAPAAEPAVIAPLGADGGGAPDAMESAQAGQGEGPLAVAVGAGASLAAPAGDAGGAAGAEAPAPATASPAGGAEGGGSDAIRILGRALPSDAGAALLASRASAEGEVASDRAALEANPPSIEAPSGLMPPAAAEAAPETDAASSAAAATAVESVTGAGGEPVPFPTTHEVASEPVPTGPSPEAVVDRAPEDPTARAERYRDAIADMPVADDHVDTDPGPGPPLELTDEADPGRLGTQTAANDATIRTEWTGAERGMQEDEGVDDIYPTLPDEVLTAPVSAGGSDIHAVAGSEPPMLRPGVRAGLDAGLGPTWDAETARAETGHNDALAERAEAEHERRAETDREIAHLESEATAEQLGARDQAHTDVADARAGWRGEIAAARGTYDNERTRIDGNLDRDVAARVARAEGDAQAELDSGHARAEARRRETETEAERRRAAAERERDEADGFFDWVASKVKSFMRKLREGLKRLFNALRAAVRTIIEGAKRLAAAAIELGRRAVVGLIRLAGAALELAADVVLAAFPAARDRAKSLIRAGTRRAEEAVNRAAEALRRGVFALLDALGAALIFILDVYEAFYSALFQALEALIIGFIEVARALFRLDLAAGYAPGELEGQIYEEMIGADLTQPLAFEATEREIADWEAGLVAGGGTDLADAIGVGDAVDTAGAPGPELPSEIVADTVLDFHPEPELVARLDPNGSNEFGENESPGNTLAALYGEATGLPAAHATGTTDTTDAMAGESPAAAGLDEGGPGSAIPGDTTDAKLDHYMKGNAAHDCRTETPTAPEGPPIPLSAKIGPLTRAQRARYMLNQAWTGIKHWVSCNWPTIIAAVLAAIIVIAAIVAVVVLSGGTVGVALSGLLTAFTGAMIIYAVARAAGFLGDYLQKSIDGDIIGGARGLARAFAVAAVEIIFAVLTYVTAGVFRVAAAGIKGAGRLVSGAARGAGRLAAGAARQTGRGLRALGTGARRVGRRLVSATGRAGRVGSAVVRRGRLVIRNVRSGFERGARNLRDLGRRLARRLPFRRYRIIFRSRWLVLQGHINPWVDIAKTDASEFVEKVLENKTRPGRRPRPGDVIRGTTKAGDEVTGTVFRGGRSNPAYRDLARLRGLDPASNVIHHAIEQQVLKRFKNLFTRAEINSASRLRAIPRGAYNARVHLSQIRRMWDKLYRGLKGARGLTAAQQRRALTAFMEHVDEFIDAMEVFSRTNSAFKTAVRTGNKARMRSLLDAEIGRLLTQARFNTQQIIDDILGTL